jgi:hypothetical protein
VSATYTYEVVASTLISLQVHYVQAQNKVEQILAAIRETISSGVEFAEEKLSQVLDVSLDQWIGRDSGLTSVALDFVQAHRRGEVREGQGLGLFRSGPRCQLGQLVR